VFTPCLKRWRGVVKWTARLDLHSTDLSNHQTLQRAPLPSSSREPASHYFPVGILLCGSLLHFDSPGESSRSLGWRFLLRDFPSICRAFRFTRLRLLPWGFLVRSVQGSYWGISHRFGKQLFPFHLFFQVCAPSPYGNIQAFDLYFCCSLNVNVCDSVARLDLLSVIFPIATVSRSDPPICFLITERWNEHWTRFNRLVTLLN